MQFPGEQSTLFPHSGLTLQRSGAKPLQRAGEMAGQRIQQFHFIRCELQCGAKKKINFTDQPLL